ncbi:hypothetical protein GCM10012280_12050 [Wenjunlia tyrosinilytica]|uniref:Beta-N-acetylhexosaminidase n=1 Tax=Wenjunlia tyrosinilytica TaxID=1544741 RepID=A0A918DV16_9ACTN|nr:hypothetical protein GCM10012280_12050 [Wenjunlia tyrosinilytica]
MHAVVLCGVLAVGGTACDASHGASPEPSSPKASTGAASSPTHSTASAGDPQPRPTTPALPPGTAALPSIPAVRSFHPASGEGWWPRSGTRVVATDASLVDEARLFAKELGGKLHRNVPAVRGTAHDAHSGDVLLALGKGPAPEGYRLDSRGTRLAIAASTDTGVFYGTRTALQSVRARGYVPSGVADDRPDRPQRGLTLDIARKHFTKDWIEARVRELGDLKLNELHLHISDDQGFRVESTGHPEVVSRDHLSKADVREIVALAASRHVTVIPEIDSPGHLGAVLAAHPGIQLRTASGTPVRGAVDISRPEAARIVDDLYREYAKLFPGGYFHIGGDEYAALMSSNPELRYPGLAAHARARFGPGATVSDAATGWLNDRADTVRRLGKTPKAWNDGVRAGPRVSARDDRQIEYWTGREAGRRDPGAFLREGRDLVNLNDEYLYYVLGQPNDFRYPTGERIYREWSPTVLRGTRPVPEGPGKVLGARLAVWCDRAQAQTQDQVARGIRLPLAALAQRLWDPGKPTQSWASFTRLADRVGQ